MARNSQEYHLRISADADISALKSELKSIEGILDKIDLGENLTREFNNLFKKLDNQISDFTIKANREINNFSDIKGLQSSSKKISDLFSTLQQKVENLDKTKITGFFTDNEIARISQIESELDKLTQQAQDVGQRFSKMGEDLKGISFNDSNIQKLVSQYISLAAEGEDYTQILEEIKKKTKDISEFKGKNDAIKSQTAQVQFFKKELVKAKAATEELQEEANKATEFKLSKGMDVSDVTSEIDKLNSQLVRYRELYSQIFHSKSKKINTRGIMDSTLPDNLTEANADLSGKSYQGLLAALQEAKQLKNALEAADAALKNFNTNQQNIKDIEAKLQEARKELGRLNQEAQQADFNEFQKAEQKVNELEQELKQAEQASENLNQELEEINTAKIERVIQALYILGKEAQQVQNPIKNINQELGNVGEEALHIQSLADDFEDVYRRAVQFFSIENAIDIFRDAIRGAFDAVKDLDAAMTDIAVVTNFEVGDVWDTLPQYTDMANELGTTIVGAYETAKLYYQQGLSEQEVMAASAETLKMARIAGMDYAEATDYMTAAVRGFKLEMQDAARVNDVFSKLAAITAADTGEIADALTRTASIANAAGMDLETTSAFLTQMIETTREAPENLGTALKTIIARFQEMKTAPGDIEVDGEVVNVNKVEGALRTVGVALRDTTGQFRDLDDVFLELSSKWNSLDTNTQRYIATIAAGSRQQSRFIAMMDNYDRTVELVNAAYNSAGAGQEQYEKTLDSLESKLNRLKNAWQEFTTGLANSDFIKWGVDALTTILTLANDLTTGFNGLSSSILKTATLLTTLGTGSLVLRKLAKSLSVVNIIKALSDTSNKKQNRTPSFLKEFFFNNNKKEKTGEIGIIQQIKNTLLLSKNIKGLGETLKHTTTLLFGFNKQTRENAKNLLLTNNNSRIASKGINALATSLVSTPWGWIAAAILAVAAALIAIGVAAHQESIEYKLEQAEKLTNAAKDAADEAKSSYENLLSGLDEYDNLQNSLDNLVIGTDDWAAALENANAKVLELISNYQNLAQYVTLGDNGQLVISDEGRKAIVEESRNTMQKTQRVASQINENNLKNQKETKDFIKSFEKENKVSFKTASALYDLSNKLNNFSINSLEQWDKLATQEKNAITEITGLSWDLIKGQISSGNPIELPIADYGDSLIAVQEYNNLLKQQELAYRGYAASLVSTSDVLLDFAEKFGTDIATNLLGTSEDLNNKIQNSIDSVEVSGWENFGKAWYYGFNNGGFLNFLPGFSEFANPNRKNFKELADYYGYETSYGSGKLWGDFSYVGYSKEEARDLYQKAFGTEASEELSKEEIMSLVAEEYATDQYVKLRENLATQLMSLGQNQTEAISKFLNEDFGNMTAEEINSFLAGDVQNLFDGLDFKAMGLNPEDYQTSEELEKAFLELLGKDEANIEEVVSKMAKNYLAAKKAAYTNLAGSLLDSAIPGAALSIDEIKSMMEQIPEGYVSAVQTAATSIEGILGKEGLNAYWQEMQTIIKSSNEALIGQAADFVNSIDWSNPINQAYKLKEGLNSTVPEIRNISESLLKAGEDIYSTSEQFEYFYNSDGFASLTEDVEEFIKENGKITPKYVKELAKGCKELNELLKQGTISAAALAKALTGLKSGELVMAGITDATLAALESLSSFESELEGLQSFVDDFDPGIDSLVGIDFFNESADTINEKLEQFEYGNPQVQKYFEAMFGPDAFTGIETAEKWISTMEDYQRKMNIWTSGGGLGLWLEMADKAAEGTTLDLGGVYDPLITSWGDDGNLLIEIGENTLTELIDIVEQTYNVSREFASSAVSAMLTYSPENLLKVRENNYQDSLNTLLDSQFSFMGDKDGIKDNFVYSMQELQVIAYAAGKEVQDVITDLQDRATGSIKIVDWFDTEGVGLVGDALWSAIEGAIKGKDKKFLDIQDIVGEFQSAGLELTEDGNYDIAEAASFFKEWKMDAETATRATNELLQETGKLASLEFTFYDDKGVAQEAIATGKTVEEAQQNYQNFMQQVENSNLAAKIGEEVSSGMLEAFSALKAFLTDAAGNIISLKFEVDTTEADAAVNKYDNENIIIKGKADIDTTEADNNIEQINRSLGQLAIERSLQLGEKVSSSISKENKADETSTQTTLEPVIPEGAIQGAVDSQPATVVLQPDPRHIEAYYASLESTPATVPLDGDTTLIQGKVNNISNELKPIVQTDADIQPAESTIDTLNDIPIVVETDADIGPATSTINTLNNIPITVAVNADVSAAASAIAGLNTSVTVTVNEVQGTTVSRSGGAKADGTPDMAAAASGAPAKKATTHSEKTLVGEEGIELAQNGHNAYILGEGGPEIVDIPEGTRIWNHEDTEKILKTGGTLSTKFSAMAPGNTFISKDNLEDYKENVDKWGGGSSSSGGSSGGGVSADGDIGDAYESALDYYWNFLIKLKKLNADLEDLLNERDRLLSKEAEALAAGDLDAVAKAQEELAKKNEEVLKQHQKVVDEQAYYISSLNGGMQKLEGMMSKYGNVVSKVDGVLKVNWESYNALGDEAKEKMDGLIEEWEDYYDRLEESKDAIQDIIDYYRDLAEEYREMHREARETFSDLIDQLKDVMIQMREDEIKATEEYYDQLIEQDEDYLDALRDNVNERRRLRDMGNSYQELSEKQRRVSLLRRDTSGVYTNEIMTLEEEIAAMQQDLADQETDNILDKMDADLQAKQEYFAKSIELMEDSLEQQIKNGEIAMRAEEMLSTAPEEAYRILTEANAEYLEMSTTQQAIFVEDLKNQMIEMNRYQTEYYLKFAEQMDAIADVILNQLIDAINSVSINNNYNYTYVGSSSSGGGSSGSGGGSSGGTSSSKGSGDSDDKEYTVAIGGKTYTGTAEEIAKSAYGSTDSTALKAVTNIADSQTKNNSNANSLAATQSNIKSQQYQYSNTDPLASASKARQNEIANFAISQGISQAEAKKRLGYSEGGYVKYTGIANVHGSPSKPEAFLSAADTRNFETLKSVLNQVLTRKATSTVQYRKNEQSDKLTTKVLNSITELKDTIKYLAKPTSSSSIIASNSNLKNGRGDCTIYITVDQIASDYDVDRAVEQVQRKILSSSSYRNINLINRTR